MTKHMADFLPEHFKSDPNLRSMFVDPTSGQFYMAGQIVRPPAKLCQTYERIAQHDGGSDFYNGTLADDILADLHEMGSSIDANDLRSYRVSWSETTAVRLGRDTLYATAAPTSGHIVGFIMQILRGYSESGLVAREALTVHRTVEAFKFAFAKRMDLCDPQFCDIDELMANLTSMQWGETIRRQIDESGTHADGKHYGAEVVEEARSHGTAHISIIAPNGDAVSVTSSINF